MVYSFLSKAVATSNDFFKNLKITIEISEICLRFRSCTLVNLVATALEKMNIPHDSSCNWSSKNVYFIQVKNL